MLLLRDGKVTEVVENALMLAAFDFTTYYSNAVQRLQSGDRLLLYTDGLVEAANGLGEFFGQEAPGTPLQQTGGAAPTAAAGRIISTVQPWGRRRMMI